MNLRTRIIFATLLSAPINATYRAVAQNAPNAYMQTLPVLPLVWFGFWFRLPFDAAFYVLVANPLDARLSDLTAIKRVFSKLLPGQLSAS